MDFFYETLPKQQHAPLEFLHDLLVHIIILTFNLLEVICPRSVQIYPFLNNMISVLAYE